MSDESTAPVTDQEADFLDYIEQQYLSGGGVPSEEYCVGQGVVSSSFYRRCFKKSNFRNALAVRGIVLRGLDGASEGRLTEEQLVVANTLLDTVDNRSKKKKLADLGISSGTYEAWLRDPVYANYIRSRAELHLGDAVSEGHVALASRARSGDINAIKYLNEITGRYNPNSKDTVDVQGIIMLVVEVIQRHVTDPGTLKLLSDDLLLILGGAKAASNDTDALPVGNKHTQPALPSGRIISL